MDRNKTLVKGMFILKFLDGSNILFSKTNMYTNKINIKTSF